MDDQDSTPDATAFRVETEFDAEPFEVWRALTEPESMGEWLGRPVEFTLEPGAEGTVGDGDGEATVLVVEEVDAERRLVFRWASTTEAPTVVEFELRPIGRRTHLTIVERPVPQGHMRRRTMNRTINGMTARACVLAHAA